MEPTSSRKLKMMNLKNLLAFTTISLFASAAHAKTEMYYIHSDHLGTPQVLTDKDQQVVWRRSQKPFGETVEESGTVIQPLRFPGQYEDPETGFHYNYFRDYDPATGRYLQSDPIGLEGGINTYGYVHQNPSRNYDPFGLLTWSGTSTTIGGVASVGATTTTYVLTSDCVNGSQTTVTVIGVGPATGVGTLAGASHSGLSIDDGRGTNAAPFPNQFNGAYINYSMDWAFIGGVGASYTTLGNVAFPSSGGQVGWGVGITATFGTATVVDQSTSQCEC